MKQINDRFPRRSFLQAALLAGGGLVIGIPKSSHALNASAVELAEITPLVKIDSNGKITIPLIMSEMGQGIYTSLPQIVADELDADWGQVIVEQAPANQEKYGFQGTWASLSVTTAWSTHREAGAKARAMLVAAAASKWGVNENECSTRLGIVHHQSSGQQLSYGDLAETAAGMSVSDKVKFKSPDQYHIIGTSKPRLDSAAKTNGSAGYGVDVKLPGLLTAALLKKPVYGARIINFSDEEALAITGVETVVEISSGLAVVADNFWSAQQGVKSLTVEWELGENEKLSSDDLIAYFHDNLKNPTKQLKNVGEVEKKFNKSKDVLTSTFELPLLAHATMEPVNFTAHVQGDKCEVWGPTQDCNATKSTIARLLKIPANGVTVNTTFVGGGFGRKTDQDFVTDAVEISQQIKQPVKVIWSREDDIKSCIFRPATVHQLSATLSGKKGKADRKISAWQHNLAGHAQQFLGWLPSSGANHVPYKIPNFQANEHIKNTPIPVGTLRGIAHSSTNFANEIFMDELSEQATQDPFSFRLSMLDDQPRAQHVLELLKEKSAWQAPDNKGTEGIYQGVALFDKPTKGNNFYIAQVVEVSFELSDSSAPQLKVNKVICVADFGQQINPQGIKDQVASGVAFALSMAMYGEINIEKGRIKQSNFHDYQVLRLSKMPEIEVHLVDSHEHPLGCGEHINPATLPALANAVYAATGERVRRLPLKLDNLHPKNKVA